MKRRRSTSMMVQGFQNLVLSHGMVQSIHPLIMLKME
jgi:hypothetical protein